MRKNRGSEVDFVGRFGYNRKLEPYLAARHITKKEYIHSMSDLVYSKEVENMCCVAKGPNHGPAPLPEEGKWVQAKQITDISGYTHGVGWCAPQQGACKHRAEARTSRCREYSR